MSLLTICQDVLEETGVAAPTSIVGSANPTAIQILALAKRSLNEVTRRHPWPVLTKEDTITTSNGTADYSLATDIDEFFYFTWWDQNDDRPLLEATPEIWQDLQSSGLTSSVRTWFFFKQGSSNDRVVSFFPTPTSARTISYWYRSKNKTQTSGGAAQETWNNDSDTALLNEDLLTLDMKWRWNRANGLPYAEDKLDFETALSREAAFHAPIVDLSRRRLFVADNIPELGWTL